MLLMDQPTTTPPTSNLVGQGWKKLSKLVTIFSTVPKETESTETRSLYNMEKNSLTTTVCGTLIICSIIIGTIMYNINDRNNMARNIEAAIQKGVDPISVKCAYETDAKPVCMAYALGKK